MANRISLFSGGLIRVAFGQVSVTGTSDLDTGMAAVYACVADLDDDVSLDSMFVQAEISATAGHVDLKVFKPTTNADVTPIASTTATVVSYIAIGK